MTTKSAANTPKAKDNGDEKPETSERKLNLLVVEDDEKILEAITEYFSRAGYNVQTAEDGLSGALMLLFSSITLSRMNVQCANSVLVNFVSARLSLAGRCSHAPSTV